jgi:hypothetical protein
MKYKLILSILTISLSYSSHTGFNAKEKLLEISTKCYQNAQARENLMCSGFRNFQGPVNPKDSSTCQNYFQCIFNEIQNLNLNPEQKNKLHDLSKQYELGRAYSPMQTIKESGSGQKIAIPHQTQSMARESSPLKFNNLAPIISQAKISKMP